MYIQRSRDYRKTKSCAVGRSLMLVVRRHDDCDTTFNNHFRHPGETCDIKTSAESRDCCRLGDF